MNDTSTRERLLQATLQVVREHGVAGATSRQIAAAAGTNLQAITYHFGSKDHLIAAALVTTVRNWLQPVRELLTKVADNPTGTLVSAAAELDQLAAQVTDQVPTYLEALALVPRHSDYRDQLQPLYAEVRADIIKALTSMQDANLLADWVEPQAMSYLIVAAADGVAVHLTVEPGQVQPQDVLQQVVGLLLGAMRPDR